MKLGILTYHSSYNFGANLQALATQSAFKSRDVTPIIINYQDPLKMQDYINITMQAQAQLHEEFMKRYLNLSELLSSPEEVEEFCLENLDAVIVGSDAVFRLNPNFQIVKSMKKRFAKSKKSLTSDNNKNIHTYWLDWKTSTMKKRIIKATIAASSTGTKYYLFNWRTYRTLFRAIKKFDFISVRDGWTQRMIYCLSLGKRLPIICPDPVFSLNENFTIPEDEKPTYDVSRTILLSGDMPRQWVKKLIKAAHRKNYMVANLPNPDKPFHFEDADYEIPLPVSPLKWYGLLANSAGFIGIRYHALVSCMSNNTPFITTDPRGKLDFNIKMRSRSFYLCKMAQATDRYFFLDKIPRSEPSEIIDRLLEEKTRENVRQFVIKARETFDHTISEIIKLL